MNKFLQTIIFFTLISVMVTFIYSSLRPAQYLAESEFLVISNNIETDCNKELGATLARAIISETFQKDLNNIQNGNSSVIAAKRIKVKNYRNSNIVNIKTEGGTLVGTQELSENIQKIILSQGHKYYSSQDKIVIRVLTGSKIVRTPKVILENTVKGLFLGMVLGFLITLLTGLRLNIFKNSKSIRVLQEKVKEKKVKHNSNGDRDYTAIIKNRLEKELSKEPIEDLTLADEGYVFEKKNTGTKKTLGKINNLQTSIKKKTSKEEAGTMQERQNVTNPIAEARVIAASTMIVGKHDKEIKADKVPENLPIFIEEDLPVENLVQKTILDESTDEGQTDDNSVMETSVELQNELPVENPKKASAHDIANGFAPDRGDVNGPSNEEIKDRLNRLLRGEL